VGELFARLDNSIRTHCRENAVIGIKLAIVVGDFKPLDPDEQPDEGIAAREVRSRINLVVIS
jgi:hypothetical protein